jgi:hypothetical protein
VRQRTILVKANPLRSEGIEDRLNRVNIQEEINGRNEIIVLTVEFADEKSVFSSQI